MCNPTTYGDTAIFHTLSLAWQAKFTIVNIMNDDIWETRYRHDDPLDEVDFILIYNGTNHFNAVSKYHLSRFSTFVLLFKTLVPFLNTFVPH